MKYAFILAALLMTSALAQAAAARSDYADPNNKYSEMGQTKKSCWRTNATGGDTTQPRLIHADANVTPESKMNQLVRSRNVI